MTFSRGTWRGNVGFRGRGRGKNNFQNKALPQVHFEILKEALRVVNIKEVCNSW